MEKARVGEGKGKEKESRLIRKRDGEGNTSWRREDYGEWNKRWRKGGDGERKDMEKGRRWRKD